MVEGRVRDVGQAVLLMLVVIVCSGLLAIAVGALGGTLRDRQQAQNAADAAALAGVEGGRAAADELARANGAVLVHFDREPAANGGGWTCARDGTHRRGVGASAGDERSVTRFSTHRAHVVASSVLYASSVASDKPRGGTGRRAWSGGDPRVEDLTASGAPHAVERGSRDRRSSLNGRSTGSVRSTLGGSTRGVPRMTPSQSPAHPSPVDDAPTAALLAPPGPPSPAPPNPAPPAQDESQVTIAPSAPLLPAEQASPATDVVPVTAGAATETVVPPAARLDLGVPARVDGDGSAKTDTVERVLEPLARLRPAGGPMVFQKSRRPRVRRVTRVVRHLDTWSVFKVALVFNLVLYVVALTAGVLLWNVAYSTGRSTTSRTSSSSSAGRASSSAAASCTTTCGWPDCSSQSV
jgi:hypothetical protein